MQKILMRMWIVSRGHKKSFLSACKSLYLLSVSVFVCICYKIMCDKIWIAAVYLKVFNLNELLNILIYNTVWPGFTDGA